MKFQLVEGIDSINYYDIGKNDYDVFVYELSLVDEYEFRDYIMKTHSKASLEDKFADQLPEDYAQLTTKNQESDLRDIVFENLEEFEDEAYEFFYDDAVQAYEEMEEYGSDNGSGMRDRDFM